VLAGALELVLVPAGLTFCVATAGPGLMARVPWPRRPAGAESHADPAPDWVDQDAVTADLPVTTGPPDAPAVSLARTPDARAVDSGDGGTRARETRAGDAADGRDGLVRDLPVRRPGSRSGHGQSRRVAGRHRAARARPAQHSGR
jgi:hypothetical protein